MKRERGGEVEASGGMIVGVGLWVEDETEVNGSRIRG